MKNKKLNDLLKFGLSKKSLLSLNESAINTLHKNLISEKKEESKEVAVTPLRGTKTDYTSSEVTRMKDTGQSVTVNGQVIPKKDGGLTVISSGREKELGEEKKKKKVNPWAVCHAQLGPKKTAKFERCVRDVKKSIAEGKDPFEVILENKIISLLEKHIKPTMKKGELFDLIGKKKMKLPIGKISAIGAVAEDTKTAPAKPTTKPTTKPSKPQTDTPYKPKHKPAPKAKKSETKEQVMTAPAPAKPTTKPTTKPSKPQTDTPYRPKHKPAPKAKKSMPNWMSFDSIGIKLKK